MITAELRESLDRAHEGGPLLGVDVFRFQGDPKFVTAVRFRFTEGAVAFLAIEDDDTVGAECGPVKLDDDGEWIDVSNQPVWSECIGCKVGWAWAMTNQQGYTDAIRIEFEQSFGIAAQIVEFVVIASAFRFFAARAM